ncbi:MAG: hypothetical protein WD068_01460 [Candidatus Babeliales bacterium]
MKRVIIGGLLVGCVGFFWAQDQGSLLNKKRDIQGIITKNGTSVAKRSFKPGLPVKSVENTTAPINSASVDTAPPASHDQASAENNGSSQKLISLEPSQKIAASSKSEPSIQDAEKKPEKKDAASSDQEALKVPADEPEKASDEDKPSQDVKKDAALEVAIDTVGIEAGGNWLHKRIWYEQSQTTLQEITSELTNILAARQQYLTARDTLDTALEQPFIEIGVQRGKLVQLLMHLLDSLKTEQKERGDLSAQERKLRLAIETQQKDLEQLTLDLESLKNLDDSLDATVKRVMEQINLAGMYNKEAHTYFDQIPTVNEQRAKELYYKIDTLHKDMLSIHSYLSGELSEYLGQVQSNADMHLAKIKSQMAAIQAKGIDFQKQLAQFEAEDKEVIEERDAANDSEQELEEPGFFGRAWRWITGWFW